jgi:CubicO group peptidase (beta-lactamase class C family)
VLDPLGMKDTCFWITAEKAARYAHTYMLNEEKGKLEETSIFWFYGTEPGDQGRPPLGGAGLFTTAEDLARFYQMTMNKGMAGGKRFLKAETVAEMTKIQIGTLSAGGGLAWGYGFCVIADVKGMEADEMLSTGSYGHVGAFGTNAWVDPERGVLYVILFERNGLENIYNSPMRIEFQRLAAKGVGERK